MKASALKLLSLLGLSVLAVPAHASLIAYWNMDADSVIGKLNPNAGSQAGTLSTHLHELQIGFIAETSSVDGTAVNMLPPAPEHNRALGFYHLGTIYNRGALVIEDFNFTGLSDVSISFAYQSENSFTWDSNLEVDYRIDGGEWVDFDENEGWATGWQQANISFGSALDNAPRVDIRVRFENWLSITGHFSIDNIQVNANPVPEPRTWALSAGALALLLTFFVRRRNSL